MKKISLYVFLVLMVCNTSFAVNLNCVLKKAEPSGETLTKADKKMAKEEVI